ncbi:hypothetical protein [Rudaeicoccus suwonensis]|uniref:Uncharacterized protein n=1 Tax=Rudaeicoccus suwonensis TaxID=657409 RepID=A0A561E0V2_9MICO|nr:hypothetical protein [Rudaeicoccus suwonensis]TWE09227.1 hypothetical protein BKA23_2927 [Rudaeicoccus suwonensis]
MVDSLVLVVLIDGLIHALASGLAGYAVAVRSGRRVWPAVVLCILLPWLGVAILAASSGARLRAARSPRNRARNIASISLLVGGLLIFASLLDAWATVSGHERTYAESFSAGPGDTGFGIMVVGIVGLVLIAMAAASWFHGGLRFGIPAAWVTAALATVMIDLAVISALLDGFVGRLRNLSADQASAQLSVGGGTWLALLGAVLGLAGALAMVLSTMSSVSAPLGAAVQAASGSGFGQPSRSDNNSAVADAWSATSTDQWGGTRAQTTGGADPWAGGSSGSGETPGSTADRWG